MTKLVTSIIVLILLGTGTAGATTIDSPGPYQGWVNTARVPTPEETITIVELDEVCGGYAIGCGRPGTVELQVPNRFTFYHELGHLFDTRYLTDVNRVEFTRLLGRRIPMEWWPADYNYDRAAAEWFADTYAQCARLRHVDPTYYYSIQSGTLVGWRLRKECQLIRSI